MPTKHADERTEPTDVLDLVLDAAKRLPNNSAISFEHVTYSYRQLADKIHQIASILTAGRKRPKVLIFLEPSIEAYTTILATLQIGGLFCPVGFNQPKERVEAICRIFEPDIIVSNIPLYLENTVAIRLTEEDLSGLNQAPSQTYTPERTIGGYVIFTSGSTGKPKGVVVHRQNIAKFIDSLKKRIKPRQSDRWAQFSNLGFDLSIVDIFMTLTSGACLIPFYSPTHRLVPSEYIKKQQVTVWHSVPSVLDLVIASKMVGSEYLGSLRIATFCGEPLLLHHAEILFGSNSKVQVFNTYGPTEATLFCTCMKLDRNSYKDFFWGSFPIGAALDGWRLEIAKPLTDPGPGELVVISHYLATGYLNDHMSTAERFGIYDPNTGERYYRTGDLAERSGGRTYFKSRADRQVKVLGNRLELGEVEAAVYAIVSCNTRAYYFAKQIVCAIEGPQSISDDAIRSLLNETLPAYAVPKRFLWLPAFPRNQNDKVNGAELIRLIEELIV